LWQSAFAPRVDGRLRPFRFHEAVLFQWINPKVWAVAVAAASGYGAGLSPGGEALRLGLTFAGLNLLVCLFWSATGSGLSRLLTNPAAWRIFTGTMAVLLAGSAGLVFF
jgi:threonine/homoserine/homoserine lactone efflux protein